MGDQKQKLLHDRPLFLNDGLYKTKGLRGGRHGNEKVKEISKIRDQAEVPVQRSSEEVE